MRRSSLVDWLRGYSIFTIVLFHLLQNYPLPGWFEKAISFGGAGVHVFILCSGFGLFLSYLGKPLNYGAFLKRRFTKVYLPFVLVVCLSFLIPYAPGHGDWYALLGNVFLFKMFDNSINDAFGGQMWFISMIFQFYLCFPVIVAFFSKIKGWKKRILIAVLISLSWATLTGYLGKADVRTWNSFFLQYLWEFVLGMEIARRYFKDPDFLRLPSKSILIVSGLVGIGLVGYSGMAGGVWKLYNDIPSLIGYLSLGLFFYSLKIGWFNRFFVYTNRFSYEWYLIHILVFHLVFHFLNPYVSSVLSGGVALSLSYVLAMGYHRILLPLLSPQGSK